MDRKAKTWMAITLALGALACALASRDVAVQEWWAGRGPVVPHDGFPADCSLCHVGEGWNEIRADFEFDHLAMTGTELVGAHARAECLRCHNDRGPVAAFAARGCAGCHEDIHRGQLGRECTVCHSQDDWRPDRQVELHGRTRFPLVGAHAATACWRCHPGAQVGNFSRADVECASCHQEDLRRATSPDHIAQGWVDDCNRCHIPTTWTGAAFNHSTFALTGAHASTACSDCHSGGVYAGTPRQCVACHLDDYQGTTNPNHQASGFGTDCKRCHTTSSWRGASFKHSFPITSGPHKQDCTECHQNPGNFQQFSCIHCHAHSKAEMDDKHDDVSGYVWQSPACFHCHPKGKE